MSDFLILIDPNGQEVRAYITLTQFRREYAKRGYTLVEQPTEEPEGSDTDE